MLDGDTVRKWGKAGFYLSFHQLILAADKGVVFPTKHGFTTHFSPS